MRQTFSSCLRHFLQSALLVISISVGVFAQCGTPLDEATIQSLSFGPLQPSVQLQPGQSVNLRLYTRFLGVAYVPVDACVVWSAYPGSLADLDSQSGLLSLDPRAFFNGASFIITANIENGRRILSLPVYVYTTKENPLVGVWKETRRFSCKSGNPISAPEPIIELVFRADGRMSATRFLFETYVDFLGTYLFEKERGGFAFVIDVANVRPFDVDGFGRFRIDDSGKLILSKLSIGRFNPGEKLACKYEFEKVRDQGPR